VAGGCACGELVLTLTFVAARHANALCKSRILEGCMGASLPYPAAPMRMWPISTRVNKPENDDPSILKPIELSAA
jgi:hypothetical protein